MTLASGPIRARRQSRWTAVRIWRAVFSGLVMKRRSKSATALSASPVIADSLASIRALRAMLVLIPPGWMVVTDTLAPSISSSIRSVSVKPRTANLAAL